jgi:hypothetical protein
MQSAHATAREPTRQRSGWPGIMAAPSCGQERSAGLAMVGVPTLPSQAPTAGLTNAGSRDNANRKRISARGANGDTTGSRQTRSAPDWRRAAAACKHDGASSTHHFLHRPAYCRGRDCRAIAPSIRTICVRALRKLLHVEPTSYRYCRAQRCSWALDYSIGLNNLMLRPPAPSPIRTSKCSPPPLEAEVAQQLRKEEPAPSAWRSRADPLADPSERPGQHVRGGQETASAPTAKQMSAP